MKSKFLELCNYLFMEGYCVGTGQSSYTVKPVLRGYLSVKPVLRGHLCTVKPVLRGHLCTVKPVLRGHLWDKKKVAL